MNTITSAQGKRVMGSDNKIVVLVDFLEESRTLVEQVCSYARRESAHVHFVYVFDFFKDDPMLENIFVERCEKRLRSRVHHWMDQFLEHTGKLYPDCTGEVATGQPQEIRRALAEKDAACLVILGLRQPPLLEESSSEMHQCD